MQGGASHAGSMAADELAELGRCIRPLPEHLAWQYEDRKRLTWTAQSMMVRIWSDFEAPGSEGVEDDMVNEELQAQSNSYDEDYDVFGHDSMGIDALKTPRCPPPRMTPILRGGWSNSTRVSPGMSRTARITDSPL